MKEDLKKLGRQVLEEISEAQSEERLEEIRDE